MSSNWRKQTRARKSHQCEICRNTIYPGEIYVRYDCTPWGHPDNEGYHTYRNCRFCDHMHYDVLEMRDEDWTPYFEETESDIKTYFYEQVCDILHPETDLETYADDFSRWTLAGGPFEKCVGHPSQPLQSPHPAMRGYVRCGQCAIVSEITEIPRGCHKPRSFEWNAAKRFHSQYSCHLSFVTASEWNARQRFYRQYPRYLPEPISYELALDLLRDRDINLNHSGRAEQILNWYGDTDNVRRAIETRRAEQ